MSLTSSISTLLSGMNAAATRLSASASNVANVQTTGPVPDANGASTAYKPLDVRQSALDNGTVTASLTTRNPAYDLQYQPGSLDANADGMVAAPNVDLAGEITDQLTAKISYEAAAKSMKVVNDMQQQTIDMVS